ncbi:hypothetical protein BRO54_2526 [Geobacillus proteiniphilus]|uniref:Uncharacterized protein n=1 Tax=Geobacillus proteiniphilus TaxID=860353 RepID=A0A1Q5SVJ0_9BACL|nr:hypothetical protein BRO54_2526 [Geobacillus proteiniphilus]
MAKTYERNGFMRCRFDHSSEKRLPLQAREGRSPAISGR